MAIFQTRIKKNSVFVNIFFVLTQVKTQILLAFYSFLKKFHLFNTKKFWLFRQIFLDNPFLHMYADNQNFNKIFHVWKIPFDHTEFIWLSCKQNFDFRPITYHCVACWMRAMYQVHFQLQISFQLELRKLVWLLAVALSKCFHDLTHTYILNYSDCAFFDKTSRKCKTRMHRVWINPIFERV